MDTLSDQSPWHRGEREIQDRLGVAERMESIGRRVIRDSMPDQHRELFERLPNLYLGLVDSEGWPWASVIEGERGFIHSPDPRRLVVKGLPSPDDPVHSLLVHGAPIGLLGLEFHTRRRIRMNGRVVDRVADGFTVEVEHSYGNCPQYIQTREPTTTPIDRSVTHTPEWLGALDSNAVRLMERSDTLFVASYVDYDGGAKRRQVDVSHRGGRPGFVKVEDGLLTIPDFSGNLFFNTLGNVLETGRAGLLFVDFSGGDVLQITGEAAVDFDSERIRAFQGAERLLTVREVRAIRRRGALYKRSVLAEYSPNSLLTGSWEEAEARIQAQAIGNVWRRFRVKGVVDESATIRSFHLQPEDGAGLVPHRAGQHVPIRIHPDGASTALVRTYTLSSAPSDGVYRISVKRQGFVSAYLHDRLFEGATLEVRSPDGEFYIDAAVRRPVVLVSVGVGVTPMIAMLRHLIYEALRTRHLRPVYFVHGARRLLDRPFDKEIAELVRTANGSVHLTRVLSDPESSTRLGEDYDVHGHIDVKLLKQLLPLDDHDVYMCGPPVFMQTMYDQLRALHVPDGRIFAEAFGPASLRRVSDAGSPTVTYPPPASGAVKVVFLASGKEAVWLPDAGSLLELAESRGLAPEFSCRGGTCGTCRTKLVQGHVTYFSKPEAAHDAGNVLICCAVPSAESGQVVLEM